MKCVTGLSLPSLLPFSVDLRWPIGILIQAADDFFCVPQLQELAYFNENLRNFVLLTTFGLKLLGVHVVTKYLHTFPDNLDRL